MLKKIILLFLFSSYSLASQQPMAATIVTGAGYNMHDSRQNLKNRVIPNVALGFNFTKNINAELNFGYITTKDKNETKEKSIIQRYNGYHHLINFSYSFFNKDEWQLFGLGGAGVISYRKHYDNRKHDMAYNLGLGIRSYVNDKVALQFSGKWMRISGKENYNNYGINLGVFLQFF